MKGRPLQSVGDRWNALCAEWRQLAQQDPRVRLIEED